jgi:glycosyltransferase involved in cell wall biosynthesis
MGPSILMMTNMPSHHKIPLGEELFKLLGEKFRMAFTSPLDKERRSLGWEDSNKAIPWAIRVWESKEQEEYLHRCIDTFDCVVKGHAPTNMVRERIRSGKLTFLFSERIFKRGFIPGFVWWFRRLARDYWPLDRSNYHLLAAGAYCPLDMQRVGMFKDRTWTSAYFPAVRTEPPPPRANKIVKMLWAGRMLDWKRVDLTIELARRLKDQAYSFSLDLIGNGPMKEKLVRQCRRNGLEDVVHFFPPTTPEGVRKAMLNADIYLMTSNYREGWGAVINEAMDSGCCVVSSKGPGAAPWLIEHERNGFLFESGNVSQLNRIVSSLLEQPEKCRKIGQEAWKTISEEWSPKVAAERFVALTEALLGRRPLPNFHLGPCSVAKVLT